MNRPMWAGHDQGRVMLSDDEAQRVGTGFSPR